jgi:hypothetical protein
MMLHPTISQQLAAERQRELLDHASRYRQARTARAARSAHPASVALTRPYLPRRVLAVLHLSLIRLQSSLRRTAQ